MLTAFALSLVVAISAPSSCPDLNGDGTVGISDLLALLSEWGPCAGSCSEDLTGDAQVDVHDLLLLLNSWDGNCGIAAPYGQISFEKLAEQPNASDREVEHMASEAVSLRAGDMLVAVLSWRRHSTVQLQSVTWNDYTLIQRVVAGTNRRTGIYTVQVPQSATAPVLAQWSQPVDRGIMTLYRVRGYDVEAPFGEKAWESTSSDSQNHGTVQIVPGSAGSLLVQATCKGDDQAILSFSHQGLDEAAAGDIFSQATQITVAQSTAPIVMETRWTTNQSHASVGLEIRQARWQVREIEQPFVVNDQSPPTPPVQDTARIATYNMEYWPGGKQSAPTPCGEATPGSPGYRDPKAIERQLNAVVDALEVADLDILFLQEIYNVGSLRFGGVHNTPQGQVDFTRWDTFAATYPYRAATAWKMPNDVQATVPWYEPRLPANFEYAQPPCFYINESGTHKGIIHGSNYAGQLRFECAVMSRHPILALEEIEVYHVDSPSNPDVTQRGIMYAQIDLNGQDMHVYNLHIQTEVATQANLPAMAWMILDHMAEKGIDPAMQQVAIVGDWNINIYSTTNHIYKMWFRILESAGFYNTWGELPSPDRCTLFWGEPCSTVDYILVSPALQAKMTSPVASRVPGSGATNKNEQYAGRDEGIASDHWAVQIEFATGRQTIQQPEPKLMKRSTGH